MYPAELEFRDVRHACRGPRLGGVRPERPAAEAVIETVRSAVVEGVATKADIADVRAEMAQLETRMTRTLYAVAAALLAGQLAAVFALLRLLG